MEGCQGRRLMAPFRQRKRYVERSLDLWKRVITVAAASLLSCESAFAEPKAAITSGCDSAHTEPLALTVFRCHSRGRRRRNHRLPIKGLTAESCTFGAGGYFPVGNK